MRIITVSGDPDSGKSTAMNLVEEKLKNQGRKVKKISTGAAFRKLAEENKMTPREYNEYLEKTGNKTIDKALDKSMYMQLAECSKIISEDEVIADARLAFKFAKKIAPETSFNIRFVVRPEIAGKRAFLNYEKRQKEGYQTLDEAIKGDMERKKSEHNRYKEYYGVDLEDLEQYDLVIDTSFANPEDIADIIIRCLEAKREEKEFAKYWMSPKQLMPIQKAEQTLAGNADSGMDLKQWKDKITREGVEIDQPVTAMKVGETYFVRDGHHRSFGAAYAGKTLIPYEVKWTDNTNYNGSMTARQFIKYSVLGDHHYDMELYVYEDIINAAKSKEEKSFYYMSIYPGIEKGKIFEGYDKTYEGRNSRRRWW